MASDGRATGDALRSELIFLGASGSATTVRSDGRDVVVIRTPDNPNYWWGNTLHFDGPPASGDVDRWTRLFDERIAALQPASRHRTFGWDGTLRGDIEPFVARGYDYTETLILAAERTARLAAPHVDPTARIAPLAGDDWDALLELLVETREADQDSLAGHRAYASARIADWRTLVDRGQGRWFGVRGDVGLQSALGLFVESQVGADGRRIGRFQHVCTRLEARRRGLAGMLVAEAARFGFDHLQADTLLLLADEHDAARRVYQAVGFVPVGWKRGLELRPARAL